MILLLHTLSRLDALSSLLVTQHAVQTAAQSYLSCRDISDLSRVIQYTENRPVLRIIRICIYYIYYVFVLPPGNVTRTWPYEAPRGRIVVLAAVLSWRHRHRRGGAPETCGHAGEARSKVRRAFEPLSAPGHASHGWRGRRGGSEDGALRCCLHAPRSPFFKELGVGVGVGEAQHLSAR